tara:strand:- start:14013 stop:16304 length:2292 start_codon:yes stop_codon:yes gene_type:complete
MPKGKPNMYAGGGLIKSLRSAHDPHFKLEGRVGGLEKGLVIEVAQLHKTLSKSFAMQRKTLVRVLGLEKKVAELEAQKAQIADVVDDIIDDGIDIDDEVPIPQEVEGERPAEGEVGGDDKPSSGVSTLIDPPKRIKVKRKKIKAADIKKGTALDKDFGSRVMGQDEKGEYLSKGERIARFKGEKFDPESVKPVEGDGDSQKDAQNSNPFAGVGSTLTTIADTVDSIYKTLQDQFKLQEDASDDARVKGEEEDVKAAEKDLEKKGGLGLGKGIKDTAAKVFKPFMSIWDRFVQFFVAIVAGKTIMKALDWFGNPENASKVSSIFRFIKDWWPVLLGSLMWFLPGLLGPAGMVAGTIVLLMWGVPKILDAVKFVMGLPGQIMDWITGKGNKDLEKVEEEAVADVTKETGDESPPIDPKEIIPDKEPKGFNKGGEVPGEGNKDTVPAMLTPGEFVMTKGAVSKFGVDTLEGMNAAAGGTNKPKKGRQFNEGGEAKAGQEWGENTQDLQKLVAPELMKFMETQNAAVDANPDAYGGVKLKMDRDGKMPNFGEFIMNQGEVAFNQGLEMLQTNESVEPEVREALIKKALYIRSETLDNPNFKGDIAFDINKDIPGTAANRLYIKAQNSPKNAAIMAGIDPAEVARLWNRRQMNKGGLVQHLNEGGLVQNMFGGAKTMFNMLPQVKAAKFVGGKAKDMFSRGKEFVSNAFDKSVNIPPPTSNDQKVTIIQQTNTSSKEPSELGGSTIPAFPVVYPAMKKNKQKLLGISV